MRKAAVDIASPESKQLLKQVSEMEPLRMAWADWENTKQASERVLCIREQSSVIDLVASGRNWTTS